MFPLNTIIAWSINIIMNKKYDNNNIIIASRAYFLHHLLGLGQLLVPDLGLDPTANDGAVGIGRLGLLGSGAGGGGAPLAHGLGAQRELWKWV
jgi:hypothetical protein